MKASRIVNLLFALLFLGTGALACVFLYRDYQHFENLRAENQLLTARQMEAREEVGQRESELERLQGDSEYIESVIRAKLNFAKEGEVVFRFER